MRNAKWRVGRLERAPAAKRCLACAVARYWGAEPKCEHGPSTSLADELRRHWEQRKESADGNA